MKNWRPKGWQNRHDTKREEAGMFSRAELFEAGADAMLEALKDNAKRFKEWEPVGKGGYLVYIPDEGD